MMDFVTAHRAHEILDVDRKVLLDAIQAYHNGKESPSDLRRKQDNYIRSRTMYNMLIEDADL